MYKKPKYLIAGDKSIFIEFGDKIDRKINLSVRKMHYSILNQKIEGIEELVPTYRSLIVYYNPLKITYDALMKKLKDIEKNLSDITLPLSMVTEIPVLYGGIYGPDLEFVAKYNKLSAEEVIKIHSKPLYFIYMLGFSPGFAYLGEMSDKIATPRLEVPRLKVPAGSVGIAGKQTGIYPIESPGGWRLIGRTPIRLYSPESEDPFLLKSGNYVKFHPIDKGEFDKIASDIKKGTYNYKVEPYAGV